jgi:hypothetical protein
MFIDIYLKINIIIMNDKKILLLCFLFIFIFNQNHAKAGEYFNVSVVDEYFCVYITDPATLELAYKDYRGEIRRIVLGNLSRGDGGFNQPWGWHIEPDSVRLVEMAVEICDGKPSFVEEDLENWLKIGIYCPWVSDIIKIGCAGITPTTTTRFTSTTTTRPTTTTKMTTTTYPSVGGCPVLKVWDGNGYKDIVKLDIHSERGKDTTTSIGFTMEPKDGKYYVKLSEIWYALMEGSHIDYVKLTDNTENECKLVSAKHSKNGDVLSAIAKSDDARIETKPGEEIDLVFSGCSGEEFVFSIEGYNAMPRLAKLALSQGNIIIIIVTLITVIVIVYGAFKFFAKRK